MSSEARLALAAQRERQRDLTEGVPMRLPNGHVWGFRPRDDEDSDSFRRRYMVVHGYTEVLEANLPVTGPSSSPRGSRCGGSSRVC